MPPPVPPTVWEVTWGKLKAMLRWLGKIFLAPGAALLVIVAAVLLASFGFKNIQIGGLLGKLFGKKDPEKKAIDTANSVPKDRVDKDGKLIQPGTPDSKGMTQAVVVPIQNPGIFSNPDHVIFMPPGETKPVEIKLPDGVKSSDVDSVVVVKPDHFVVTVKDSSGVKASTVDALLKKYGG